MNPSLTAAIKEAYAVAPAAKVILNTLEISQEGVQDTIYLVQSAHGFHAIDEDDNQVYFEPSGFQFSLPPSNEEGFKSLNIAIDNVGRRVSDFIATSLTQPVPVVLKYRPYLSDDPTAPQMVPPLTLFLKDVQITDQRVSGKATFIDIVNKKFPSERYTRERFPGLG